MARIVLPPGPISAPILSGGMCVRSRRGAHVEISAFGRAMAVSILRRISIRASRLWASVASMISSLMPLIFRSSWMPVMPFCVPAILKSMSPKWSSSPMMSVSKRPLVAFLDQADRDAGHRIGDRHAGGHQAQRGAADLAIELEPFDSRMSEMTRIV